MVAAAAETHARDPGRCRVSGPDVVGTRRVEGVRPDRHAARLQRRGVEAPRLADAQRGRQIARDVDPEPRRRARVGIRRHELGRDPLGVTVGDRPADEVEAVMGELGIDVAQIGPPAPELLEVAVDAPVRTALRGLAGDGRERAGAVGRARVADGLTRRAGTGEDRAQRPVELEAARKRARSPGQRIRLGVPGREEARRVVVESLAEPPVGGHARRTAAEPVRAGRVEVGQQERGGARHVARVQVPRGHAEGRVTQDGDVAGDERRAVERVGAALARAALLLARPPPGERRARGAGGHPHDA